MRTVSCTLKIACTAVNSCLIEWVMVGNGEGDGGKRRRDGCWVGDRGEGGWEREVYWGGEGLPAAPERCKTIACSVRNVWTPLADISPSCGWGTGMDGEGGEERGEVCLVLRGPCLCQEDRGQVTGVWETSWCHQCIPHRVSCGQWTGVERDWEGREEVCWEGRRFLATPWRWRTDVLTLRNGQLNTWCDTQKKRNKQWCDLMTDTMYKMIQQNEQKNTAGVWGQCAMSTYDFSDIVYHGVLTYTVQSDQTKWIKGYTQSRGAGVHWVHMEGFQPEWYISTIYHAWDTPFWSGTLDIMVILLTVVCNA